MKAEADLHFLQGITQLIGHGWPYTSEGVDYPGWRFYAAAVFNDSNPWFIAMPDVSRYLQRVSFMMRQGAPANDVAFYLPVSDAYASFTVGRSIHLLDVLKERIGTEVMGRIFDAGFNLDLVDDDALRLAGKVEGDALVLGRRDGNVTESLSRDRAAGRRAPAARHAAHARCVRPRRRHLDRHAPPARDRAGLPRDGRGACGSARHDRASVQRPDARAKLVADEKEVGAALRQALTPDVELSSRGNTHAVRPRPCRTLASSTAGCRTRTCISSRTRPTCR